MAELLTRGVKRAPYTVHGRSVFICVDSFGNMVRQVALKPGVDPLRVADHLTQWLDRTHPVPKLELVQPASAKRLLKPAREIDPRLYNDPRSPLAKRRYVLHLARNAAAKMPRIERDG